MGGPARMSGLLGSVWCYCVLGLLDRTPVGPRLESQGRRGAGQRETPRPRCPRRFAEAQASGSLLRVLRAPTRKNKPSNKLGWAGAGFSSSRS